MCPAEAENVSRRGFLAGGALLGTWFATQGELPTVAKADSAVLNSGRPDADYQLLMADHQILSACLQCNTGCGIRAKIENGVVTTIDGNPYSPWTLQPQLDYKTPIEDAAPVDGSICPKGQAGLQTAYDPYRIRKVLKRAGKRGENKWISIPFDQAMTEIAEGGKLFASVPGEESREVEGLKSILALKDVDASKAMTADVQKIWDEKDPAKKAELVTAFKTTHAAYLDTLIDPDHPDLGPKNNQLVIAWGRLKDGRGDLYKRLAASMGTMNAHGHTTVCQGSLYFTCKAISEQYIGGKFTDGKKFYWQADALNSEFVLFVGANLFDANYGPPNRSLGLTQNLVTGKTKIAVADPRFSKLASKAWKWLPVKPGSDGALAMAVTRWMIEEKRIDSSFLACANKAAATSRGEEAWANGTWLVVVKDGKPGSLLRAADLVINGAPLRAPEPRTYKDPKTGDPKDYDETFMVVMVGGKPVAVDPNDDKTPVFGDLFVDTTLPDGTVVKSGLQVLLESSQEKSMADWAQIAGVPEDDIVAVARELTSHGKRAAVDIHRGVAQHTNGFYSVLGWMTVNMLLGNFNAKGGMMALSTYDINGAGKGEFYDTTKSPGKISAFGVTSIRSGNDYEKTTLFADYPAKRNWYPLASDIYEEIVPSIGDAYPYPVKALISYMGTPAYALPAGNTNIPILADVTKLPLYISSDILIGTTSMYADYIVPDLSYLERWEFHGSHPNIPNKVQPVRQPVIAPIPEEATVYGAKYPISLETLCLGLAEKLDLPGFGADAFGKGKDLKHPDDLYLRQVANVAWGEAPDGSKAVPDAGDRELEIFLTARKHLPPSVFDAARWEAIVGPKVWRKVVFVLNRGGRFEDYSKAYAGERVGHPYDKLLNLYQEKTAKTTSSGTGEHNSGVARYLPVLDYLGKEPDGYRTEGDLAMITHKVISQTKSRTVADPWLSALMPENGILMNPVDSQRLGLTNGQEVKVVSSTNTSGEWDLGAGGKKAMIGKVIETQGMRPGVVSFAHGFGNWATGANDVTVDGVLVKGEPRRTKGLHANAAMWTDPTLTNTCMFDPVGGSVSFYDTHIRLESV